MFTQIFARPVVAVALILTAVACTTLTPSAERKVASEDSPNYPQILQAARELLNSKLTPEQAKIQKKIPESFVVESLQANPARMTENRANLLLEIAKESSSQASDPTKHLRLMPPKGQPGYSELQFFATHPYYRAGKLVPASNLVKVWADFLRTAKKQIILNVYDFDLEQVAQVLVDKAREGVDVRVGIDASVIADRPEVKKIHDLLVAGGVKVTPVNSVGLNHQKVTALDWESETDARVLFSSGNLTQSCLGPEGDLKDLPPKQRPPQSVPNANHMLTMKSWLLANLVHHELTKTLDPNYLYRGSQYPTTGSYQVTGPGVDPETLEAYPENSLIITFAPGGGFRDINKNLIAHIIRNSDGPIRMLQFAYSSEPVANALLERAVRASSQKKKFDFLSIGDTPFAVQPWSQFLKMSALAQVETDGKKKYIEDLNSPWLKSLPKLDLWSLRQKIRIAPEIYGNNQVKINGKSVPVSAKIHHKIIATGPFAIVGTSFNFSEAAETNNEQILVFKDKNLVDAVSGMVRYLNLRSLRSVYEEAQRRNARGGVVDDATQAGDAESKAAVAPPPAAPKPPAPGNVVPPPPPPGTN
jgi:phosphatidylserine/phosphatidylglycerophosphate/cardiolipin synthase-like enzyme